MSVVQSVIPISAALILIAEFMHLVDLVGAPGPRRRVDGAALSDGLPLTRPCPRAFPFAMTHHAGAVRGGAGTRAPQRADRRLARASSRSSRWSRRHGLAILPNIALVTYNGATSFPLLAIPLFILAGAIMNASGISSAADRVRVVAVRLDARRARARLDRRVDVLRRDLGLGGRRRRRAGLDPDPGHEGEGLSRRRSPPR